MAIIMLGGNLAMDCRVASHPGGCSNIPSRFMLQKPELSAGLADGPPGSYGDFTLTTTTTTTTTIIMFATL